MKKLVRASLFVFFAVVVSTLTVIFLFYHINKTIAGPSSLRLVNTENASPENNFDNSGNANISNDIDNKNGISLSAQEIAKHNSSSSCWMIMDNKVYDFTSYLDNHPGGLETILPYCGKDGTDAFNAEEHSPDAVSSHASYYIGELNQSSSSTPVLVLNSK